MVTRAERSRPTDSPHMVLGYVTLTFRIVRAESKDCAYAAECIELETASCGATIDQAAENIEDATVQYLNAIERNGEVERVFRKRHIPIFLGEPNEPVKSIEARPNEFIMLFLYRMLNIPDGMLTRPIHAKTASM